MDALHFHGKAAGPGHVFVVFGDRKGQPFSLIREELPDMDDVRFQLDLERWARVIFRVTEERFDVARRAEEEAA